jgi:hypothetical protein
MSLNPTATPPFLRVIGSVARNEAITKDKKPPVVEIIMWQWDFMYL